MSIEKLYSQISSTAINSKACSSGKCGTNTSYFTY